MGGYIASDASICDAIRSYAPGFIFTTSLAPTLAAGALASIQHLQSSEVERALHQQRVRQLKAKLSRTRLPTIENESHIVPVPVGCPTTCKAITDQLMEQYAIYVQPINYPTVPRGTERLRLCPSPVHSEADIDEIVSALDAIWDQFDLARVPTAQAAE